MPLLFVVQDVFAIKERGVVAIGKLADPEHARFRIGDPVEVRRTDGGVVKTAIIGVPMGMAAVGMAEVLLRGVSASDVRPGDAVWVGEASL